jgi:hypothetical protein
VFNKNRIVLADAGDIVILSQSKYMIDTFDKIKTEAKKFRLIVNNEKIKIIQSKAKTCIGLCRKPLQSNMHDHNPFLQQIFCVHV